MRGQLHERSSFTLRVMCYSRPLHTLALKTQGCHLSLGQVALALYDSNLRHEAKTFLRFFKLKEWERRLDAQSRWSDYDFLVEDSVLSAPRQ
jgi:hypothetical protein